MEALLTTQALQSEPMTWRQLKQQHKFKDLTKEQQAHVVTERNLARNRFNYWRNKRGVKHTLKALGITVQLLHDKAALLAERAELLARLAELKRTQCRT